MSLKAFTHNSKTVLSIDFDRIKTCPQICSYCYVETMERLYPAYKTKIQNNYEWALKDPLGFAAQLNREYRKLRNSKSKNWKNLEKLPIRIYGAGDYIPTHYNFIKELKMPFYIISKTLTMSTMRFHINQLLALKNLSKIVLSLDSDNIENYENVKDLYGEDKISFSFTGMPDEFQKIKYKNLSFDIFFNIGNKKTDKIEARKFSEQCPCDTSLIPHKEACTKCNKCWRSSLTKSPNWNKISN